MMQLKQTKISPVKGGWIKRDTKNGRLVSVGTSFGETELVSVAKSISGSVLLKVSTKRRAALERLKDR